MPLRLEIERGDLGVRRFSYRTPGHQGQGLVYPTLRVLDDHGAILWSPKDPAK